MIVWERLCKRFWKGGRKPKKAQINDYKYVTYRGGKKEKGIYLTEVIKAVQFWAL